MSNEKPSQELSVETILSLTFKLYSSNFLQFFLPFLISGLILGMSSYAITSNFPIPEPPEMPVDPDPTFIYNVFGPWFSSLISTLLIVLALSAFVSWILSTTIFSVATKTASDHIETGASNLGASFKYTLSKFPSLLPAQLVTGILTVAGLVFFVVPGVIIAIIFSLVIPSIVIEQKGIFESMGRSRQLVDHRWGKTLVLVLILGIFIGIVIGVVNAAAMPLNVIHPIIGPLVTNAASAFLTPMFPIALTYLYYSMVARENQPPLPAF